MEYLKGEQEEKSKKWMDEAAKVAEKALCLKAKCGAIIVSEGKIIGKGYNAPPLDNEENRICNEKFDLGKPNYDKTRCVHAEWRAIMDALKNNPKKVRGSKLYFVRVDQAGEIKKSGKPYCTVCSRLALDTSITYFLLWHEGGGLANTQQMNTITYLMGTFTHNKGTGEMRPYK